MYEPTWVRVTVEAAGWVSIVAFTLATGGAAGGLAGALSSLGFLGGAVGSAAIIGGVYNERVNGGSFGTGAYYGAHAGAFVAGFQPQIAAAGSTLLRLGDDGAEGAINLARGLFGGPPVSPAVAVANGGIITSAADEAAIAAVAWAPGFCGGVGEFAEIGTSLSALLSLGSTSAERFCILPNGRPKVWHGDVQGFRVVRKIGVPGAIDEVAGSGVVLRDSFGSILKVGRGDFADRASYYARLARRYGFSLEMELYQTRIGIGDSGRSAIESAMRSQFTENGALLPWDGTGIKGFKLEQIIQAGTGMAR